MESPRKENQKIDAWLGNELKTCLRKIWKYSHTLRVNGVFHLTEGGFKVPMSNSVFMATLLNKESSLEAPFTTSCSFHGICILHPPALLLLVWLCLSQPPCCFCSQDSHSGSKSCMVMAASTQLSKDVHRVSEMGRERKKRRHRTEHTLKQCIIDP
jgi:hypothetical protein